MIDLPSYFEGVKQNGPDRWLACCSAHDDTTPSLSLRLVDDRWLVHCFGGCAAIDVVNAVGLELADLFEDSPLTATFKHRHKPVKRRIPASDALAAIDHEVTVASLILADVLKTESVDDESWNRLALACARIGNARALR